MSSRLFNLRLAFSMGISAVALVLVIGSADAGGPNFIDPNSGQPVLWARSEVRGGALDSQTVDADGRVLYRVDSGPLGPLSNAEAVQLADHIFGLYDQISTSSLRFRNAGPIRDPANGEPIDVNGANFGRFLSSRNPTFQNPIIFDTDNSITGDRDVLGFAGVLALNEDETQVFEAIVVLNGSVVQAIGGKVPFQGIFTHEFGHFAGPLDHSQINGNIASDGDGAVLPAGFDRIAAFDLYTPFTETMYPFLFPGTTRPIPGSSALVSRGFNNSGFFIASLDMDTSNAMSNLYPTPEYLAQRGAIEGRVLIRTASGDFPVTGINVVARRIDKAGVYPPAPTTLAFPNNQIAVTEGVPNIPGEQSATDALATAASTVTGYELPGGAYRIQGLPPGQYIVEIQQINPQALDGSGIGPLASFFQFPLGVEEFYNGPLESGRSTDIASAFTAVTVNANDTTPNIDVILNISDAAGSTLAEREPNDKTAKAQKVDVLPGEITANAASSDASLLKMTFPDGSSDKIEDLYKFTLTTPRIVYILMEPTSGSGDLDLYLFNSAVSKKKTNINDPNLIDFSLSISSTEFIPIELPPGTYIIGVSAFEGSQGYRLRVLPTP
ncbi:MAG TPA: PPC domain-containing protein [Blastocatellia bacterium]|jgi:hypothetical protein|nr:PPC domain-containing protein [Blastocatellia bacterium]